MKDNKIENKDKPTIFVGGTSKDIIFINKDEIMKITANGDMFVLGTKILNDPKVYEELSKFFYKD